MGDTISMGPNQPGQQPTQPIDQNSGGAFPPAPQDQPALPSAPSAPLDTLGGDPMLASAASSPQPIESAPPLSASPTPTSFSQAAQTTPSTDQAPQMPSQQPVDPQPLAGDSPLSGVEQTPPVSPVQDAGNPLAVPPMANIEQSQGGGGGAGRKLMGVGLIVLAVIILIGLVVVIF